MWPFKKPDTRPRILLIDNWHTDGSADMAIRRVDKIGGYFVMTKYGFESEVYILEPEGGFRGKTKMKWEMIDEIPGLVTHASVAFAKRAAEAGTKGTAPAVEP